MASGLRHRPADATYRPASDGIYDVIGRRRDVRAEFTGAPIDYAALQRILTAAHTAPSVGMSQPWDFVLVEDRQTRSVFHAHVRQERDTFHESLSGERADTFGKIKIEGILDSSLGVSWVSFFREPFLEALLGIPSTIRPVAWLCGGPVTALQHTPDLQRHGWREPAPSSSVVHYEHFDGVRP